MDEQINIYELAEIKSFLPANHEKQIKIIENNLPAIRQGTKNFNKSQSQFMDNMLTVTQLTPIRRARQILAEIEKSMEALRKAYFKRLKLKESMHKKTNAEVAEIESDLVHSEGYISGAIRKISALSEQYNSILKAAGYEDGFSEEDFEREEVAYHIMTAFRQALHAAMSRGGKIDEGNLEYLFQLGINGTTAQHEVDSYLKHERKIINEGRLIPHAMTLEWLKQLVEKYSESVAYYAKIKGQELIKSNCLLSNPN